MTGRIGRFVHIASTMVVMCLTSCGEYGGVTPAAVTASAYDRYMQTKQGYDTARQNYSSAAPSFTGQTPEKILHDYEIVLSAYSQAAQFWLSARLEGTNSAPPPALDALPAPSGKATIADVDANYERMLRVDAEMFRIDEAAPTRIVEIPDDPPLPPLQKASDPRFARLVKIRTQVDAQIRVIVARSQASTARSLAASRAAFAVFSATVGMQPPPSEPFDPMTGRPYPKPSARGSGGGLHACPQGPGPGEVQVGTDPQQGGVPLCN
jgi:hypothetical protein